MLTYVIVNKKKDIYFKFALITKLDNEIACARTPHQKNRQIEASSL